MTFSSTLAEMLNEQSLQQSTKLKKSFKLSYYDNKYVYHNSIFNHDFTYSYHNCAHNYVLLFSVVVIAYMQLSYTVLYFS